MSLPVQRSKFKWFSSELNKNHLHYYRKDDNYEEHIVVEEVLKHIQFSALQFTTVDLIEDLHEYKSVEEYTEVLTIFFIPFFLPKSIGYYEN